MSSIPASEAPPTRFELELEFVQMLANPSYLAYLASAKYLQREEFINYLAYLQYWTQPPYVQWLKFPMATLKNLELLQQEDFRRDIIKPDIMYRLREELLESCARKS
ncbi:hypothetical protein MMC10_005632 [Thelotrema lepadinum]|nr:hypothetical protein [Thelotrema lepadinum]